MAEMPKWLADIALIHYYDRGTVRGFVRAHLEQYGEAASDEEIYDAADELVACLSERRAASDTEFWSAEQMTAMGDAFAASLNKPLKEIGADFRAAFERLQAERKIRVLKCDTEDLLARLWSVHLGVRQLPDDRIVGAGHLNYMPAAVGRMVRLLKAEVGGTDDEEPDDSGRVESTEEEDRPSAHGTRGTRHGAKLSRGAGHDSV